MYVEISNGNILRTKINSFWLSAVAFASQFPALFISLPLFPVSRASYDINVLMNRVWAHTRVLLLYALYLEPINSATHANILSRAPQTLTSALNNIKYKIKYLTFTSLRNTTQLSKHSIHSGKAKNISRIFANIFLSLLKNYFTTMLFKYCNIAFCI